MKEKLFCDDGEAANYLSYWVDIAYDSQAIIEIELQKSDVKAHGDMWCKHQSEFVERGCSEGCEAYDPRNHVSGRCRSSVHGLIGTGIKYNVYPDGSTKRITL